MTDPTPKTSIDSIVSAAERPWLNDMIHRDTGDYFGLVERLEAMPSSIRYVQELYKRSLDLLETAGEKQGRERQVTIIDEDN